MDYRIKDKSSTAFTYVLPFKKNKALIEHTYFSKNECEKNVYEKYLMEYIEKFLKISDYEIIESESGVIPMTSYPFYKDSSKKITKIGSAGGWIKPSTGYSFYNCEKYSLKISICFIIIKCLFADMVLFFKICIINFVKKEKSFGIEGFIKSISKKY